MHKPHRPTGPVSQRDVEGAYYMEMYESYSKAKLLEAGVIEKVDDKLLIDTHFDKTLKHFLRFLRNTGEIPSEEVDLTEDEETEEIEESQSENPQDDNKVSDT